MAFDPVTHSELPSTVVTELHLLRHGHADTGTRRLAYGHTDIPLSSTGRAETEALLAFARDLPRPDGVISSDLARCTALARPLAEALGVPLVESASLREQHMGDWEGVPWADLNAADPQAIHDFWDDYLSARPPGGETWGEMAERVQSWFGANDLAGRRWIVVTHIGVVRALLCQALDVPLDQALRWAPARASHTHLLLAEAGAVLNILGERPAGAVTRNRIGVRPRIALSGSAGIGKTTLGRRLAKELDLPFIEEGMRTRLEAGLVLHDLSRDEMVALLRELWAEQLAAEERAVREAGGFVADRSAVDFAVFWMWYGFTRPEDGPDAFVDEALAHARAYDHIVLLPFGVLPIEADGFRSSNTWLQRKVHLLMSGLHAERRTGGLLRVPELTELEERVSWVLERTGR
ncbi:MAG: AAA family ATPase [Proteobacteria bacterium]|nr:AAA family ATPase [Pseudomonadota bacterium]MCP4919779.1 AAA family ATPase [Pseudomonadota bacterium]